MLKYCEGDRSEGEREDPIRKEVSMEYVSFQRSYRLIFLNIDSPSDDSAAIREGKEGERLVSEASTGQSKQVRLTGLFHFEQTRILF